jgi:hypothetical protein
VVMSIERGSLIRMMRSHEGEGLEST